MALSFWEILDQWKICGDKLCFVAESSMEKNKNIKNSLGAMCNASHWRRDCALCVIGNEFPCHQPHNPSTTLSRGLTTAPRIKTARRFTAKNP